MLLDRVYEPVNDRGAVSPTEEIIRDRERGRAGLGWAEHSLLQHIMVFVCPKPKAASECTTKCGGWVCFFFFPKSKLVGQ